MGMHPRKENSKGLTPLHYKKHKISQQGFVTRQKMSFNRVISTAEKGDKRLGTKSFSQVKIIKANKHPSPIFQHSTLQHFQDRE